MLLSILIKVNEDIAVQSQKYSSLLVDAYDIVEILWKHVLDYYQSLHSILEVIADVCVEIFANVHVCHAYVWIFF